MRFAGLVLGQHHTGVFNRLTIIVPGDDMRIDHAPVDHDIRHGITHRLFPVRQKLQDTLLGGKAKQHAQRFVALFAHGPMHENITAHQMAINDGVIQPFQ